MSTTTMLGAPGNASDCADACADAVRRRLRRAGVASLELVSAPGAGTTALLARTVEALAGEVVVGALTGGPDARGDAARLSRHGAQMARAIRTARTSPIDAQQVDAALRDVDLAALQLLLVERGGDGEELPDIGADARAVLFPVTAGESLPLRAPGLVHGARYALVTKVDLVSALPFDARRAIGYARDVSPDIDVIFTSAVTGVGIEEWCDALRERVRRVSPAAWLSEPG